MFEESSQSVLYICSKPFSKFFARDFLFHVQNVSPLAVKPYYVRHEIFQCLNVSILYKAYNICPILKFIIHSCPLSSLSRLEVFLPKHLNFFIYKSYCFTVFFNLTTIWCSFFRGIIFL